MTPHPEEAKRYAQSVLQRLETSPGALNKHELKLGQKFKESDARIQKISNDCEDIRGKIQQMQAMLVNAESQLSTERGRCQGFLDYLVELHFDSIDDASVAGTSTVAKREDNVHSIEEAKPKTNQKEEPLAAESAAPTT